MSMSSSYRKCCVPGCPSRKRFGEQSNISMHIVPHNPIIGARWAELLGLGPKTTKSSSYRYVCSLHFKKSQIKHVGPKAHLIHGSLPSLNLVERNDPESNSANEPASSLTLDDICNEALSLEESDANVVNPAPVKPKSYVRVRLTAERSPFGIAVYTVPYREFTEPQKVELMDAIGNALCNVPDDAVMPQFVSTVRNECHITVVACDQYSLDWLKETIPSFKIWDNAELHLISCKDIPTLVQGELVLPARQELRDEDILRLLSRQNPGLAAMTWRIYSKEQGEHDLRLAVGVPRETVDILKGKQNYLQWSSSQVQWKIAGTTGYRRKQLPSFCQPRIYAEDQNLNETEPTENETVSVTMQPAAAKITIAKRGKPSFRVTNPRPFSPTKNEHIVMNETKKRVRRPNLSIPKVSLAQRSDLTPLKIQIKPKKPAEVSTGIQMAKNSRGDVEGWSSEMTQMVVAEEIVASEPEITPSLPILEIPQGTLAPENQNQLEGTDLSMSNLLWNPGTTAVVPESLSLLESPQGDTLASGNQNQLEGTDITLPCPPEQWNPETPDVGSESMPLLETPQGDASFGKPKQVVFSTPSSSGHWIPQTTAAEPESQIVTSRMLSSLAPTPKMPIIRPLKPGMKLAPGTRVIIRRGTEFQVVTTVLRKKLEGTVMAEAAKRSETIPLGD